MLNYVFSAHARHEVTRRGLWDLIDAVVDDPEQYFYVRPGREVRQSIVHGARRRYLMRAFVDVDCVPAEVVTAYLTCRIDRHWRAS